LRRHSSAGALDLQILYGASGTMLIDVCIKWTGKKQEISSRNAIETKREGKIIEKLLNLLLIDWSAGRFFPAAVVVELPLPFSFRPDSAISVKCFFLSVTLSDFI
jgi:hypothetical protein